MSEQRVFLNGKYLPLAEAKVSVLDRGFIFADGVYEVIPAYGGRLFRLAAHLQRLQDSLDAIRLNNPYRPDEWQSILNRLVAFNAHQDQSVYLQLTRGVAPRDHGFPLDITPTVFAMASPLKPVDAQLLETGIEAVSLPDSRWQHCNIKGIALLANILLRQQAMDENAMEAILVRAGLVTEGAASNVFIVERGVIKTPSKGPHLLAGITRDLIVELAHANHMPCEETDIDAQQLAGADEVWLSSSSREILPVTRLNHRPIGDGRPGPVWQKMYTMFQDYKIKLRQ